MSEVRDVYGVTERDAMCKVADFQVVNFGQMQGPYASGMTCFLYPSCKS